MPGLPLATQIDQQGCSGCGRLVVIPIRLDYLLFAAHPVVGVLIGLVVSLLLGLLAVWLASTTLRKVVWGVVWSLIPAVLLIVVPVLLLEHGQSLT